MGYTHYWYREAKINPTTFNSIVADFNKIVLALADMGIQLADGCGENVPVLTKDEVYFNGYAKCGHKVDSSISIPWPSKVAQGVMAGQGASGTWFAGTTLDTRVCNGDCSYETFAFPCEFEKDKFLQESSEHKGLFFECCKTAYRPYDVAVTAFLIIAKNYLKEKISVSSDGEDKDWQDGKVLCYAHLGYGMEFELKDELLSKL